MSSSGVPQKLIVTGEDEESEGEIDIEFEQPVLVPVNDPSLVNNVGRKVEADNIVPGQAPESDIEGT